MLDIALEVPLPLFFFGRFFKCHDTGPARVEVFHEAFDGATLAGRVPALTKQHDPLPGFLDPALHLEQFNLQLLLFRLVLVAPHFFRVGVVGIGKYLSLAKALYFAVRGKFLGFPFLAKLGQCTGVFFSHCFSPVVPCTKAPVHTHPVRIAMT